VGSGNATTKVINNGDKRKVRVVPSWGKKISHNKNRVKERERTGPSAPATTPKHHVMV